MIGQIILTLMFQVDICVWNKDGVVLSSIIIHVDRLF
jgi:hypothetical protein